MRGLKIEASGNTMVSNNKKQPVFMVMNNSTTTLNGKFIDGRGKKLEIDQHGNIIAEYPLNNQEH